jgi:hypothetical protein
MFGKRFAVLRAGFAIAVGLSVSWISPALGRTPDCEAIAAKTAGLYSIPEGLMPAIARVETGLKQGERGVRAWPWTLNVQGQGYYFKTRNEALAKLREVLASGVRNVDVGCMQINYRWHGENFSSIEEMMSPEANTRYAANFLTRLKKRHGSWEAATRHYHSADRERGTAYLGRVNRVLARLPQEEPSFVASTAHDHLFLGGGNYSGSSGNEYALIAFAGQRQTGTSVVLPDSPLPQLNALYEKQNRNMRRVPRQRGTPDRLALVAALRREFAQ